MVRERHRSDMFDFFRDSRNKVRLSGAESRCDFEPESHAEEGVELSEKGNHNRFGDLVVGFDKVSRKEIDRICSFVNPPSREDRRFRSVVNLLCQLARRKR